NPGPLAPREGRPAPSFKAPKLEGGHRLFQSIRRKAMRPSSVDLQKLGHTQIPVRLEMLWQEADRLRSFGRRKFSQVAPAQSHLTFRRRYRACKRLQERRLTGAVGPNYGNRFGCIEIQ